MRKILNRITLALAGLGLLTGVAGADFPAKLHDEVRHRVINGVGSDQISDDALRTALGKDPDFGLLLEYYLERCLNTSQDTHHADDAFQQTILKIWKGRPQIFLKPHDEVIKYFKTSTKHNYFTEIRKAAVRNKKREMDQPDMAEIAGPLSSNPAEEAATRDLHDKLVSRLSQSDLDVMDAYLSGTNSQRKIADALGISRYAVRRSTENIQEELLALLQDATAPIEQD
jgi:RNA polymerase sigma factor (sigma-70 family)